MTKTSFFVSLILGCCVFSACSSSSKLEKTPPPVRTPIAKIAFIAVTEPVRLSVENRGGPLNFLALPGYVITKKIKENRSDFLASTLRNNSLKLGEEMSVALVKQLTDAGYVVEVLKDVKRPMDDPDDIDYEKLNTDADAILVAKFSDVGLYAGQFSKNFVPRLNLEIEVLAKKDLEDLYSQSFYYGADAQKIADDKIPSDPKYSYSSFDNAMERQVDLVECFRTGVLEIAVSVAKQMRSRGI